MAPGPLERPLLMPLRSCAGMGVPFGGTGLCAEATPLPLLTMAPWCCDMLATSQRAATREENKDRLSPNEP